MTRHFKSMIAALRVSKGSSPIFTVSSIPGQVMLPILVLLVSSRRIDQTTSAAWNRWMVVLALSIKTHRHLHDSSREAFSLWSGIKFRAIPRLSYAHAAAMPAPPTGEGHGGAFGQLLDPTPYHLAQCFGNEHNDPQLNLLGPRQTI